MTRQVFKRRVAGAPVTLAGVFAASLASGQTLSAVDGDRAYGSVAVKCRLAESLMPTDCRIVDPTGLSNQRQQVLLDRASRISPGVKPGQKAGDEIVLNIMEGPPLLLPPPPPPSKPMAKDTGDCVWGAMGTNSRKAVVASLAADGEVSTASDKLMADPAFGAAVQRCNVDFERNLRPAVGMTMGAVMSNAALEILSAKGYDQPRLQRAWDAAPQASRADVQDAARKILRREKVADHGDLSGLLTELGIPRPTTPAQELLVRQVILYYLMTELEREAIAALG